MQVWTLSSAMLSWEKAEYAEAGNVMAFQVGMRALRADLLRPEFGVQTQLSATS